MGSAGRPEKWSELRQEQMAWIMGVSLITCKRWETNVFSPDYGTPNQLAPVDCENLAVAAEAIADVLAKAKVS